MPHQSRRKFTNPKTGDNTDARTSPLQPHIVKPEHAVPMKAFGLDLKVLLSTEDTSGAISVLMGWHKPGEGPGDHVHFSQEEMFFIVEGTYEMTVGGRTTMAGPGTIVFIPRNVVHARLEPAGWSGSLLQSDLRTRRRRRLHRREGDGDKQEVRHEVPRGSLSFMRRKHTKRRYDHATATSVNS